MIRATNIQQMQTNHKPLESHKPENTEKQSERSTALPVSKQPIRHSVTEDRWLMVPARHSRPVCSHPQRRRFSLRDRVSIRNSRPHTSLDSDTNELSLSFPPASPPLSSALFRHRELKFLFLFPLCALWGWERPQLKQSHVINCSSWREAPALRRERYSAAEVPVQPFLRE